MLSDPKKLRTPGGFGYLVSWRDRFRNLDERRAEALARRLVNEPDNLEAIRTALGRADATEDEVVEWLAGALAAGSIVALRTQRRPAVFDRPDEVDWRDLVGPDGGDDENVTATTWLELVIVDERGDAVPGIAVRLASGQRAETDGKGVARFDDVPSSFGRAFIDDAAGLREAMRARWAEPTDGDWIEPEVGPHLTISGLEDPLPEFGLQGRTPHRWVVQPRVERVRIVGNVFDLDKAFVLPEALPLLRDVVGLYGPHEGAAFVVVGHTDTSGEPEHNDALSLDRARAVRAYLTDDVDTWLSFYESAPSEAQRWGDREDALLLEHGLWRLGLDEAGSPVRTYQEARSLQVDGDMGPQTRRSLIADYMSVDGSTAPAATSILVRGYGERYPLADDGESLDVDPPDGVEDPTDRRVEIYVFDAPLGVLPDVEDPEAYTTWRARSRQTHDMLVVRPLALAVRVVDETSGVPIAGAAVSLVGVGLLGAGEAGATDAFGVRAFLGISAGAYHLEAEKDGFIAASGEHRIDPGALPAVVTLALEPLLSVAFVVGVRDPAGLVIPMPPGVTVTLEHEGGPAIEGQVGEGGIASFDVARRGGKASLRVSLPGGPCLLQAPSGEVRLASVDEAMTESKSGARFIKLPAALQLGDGCLVLDGHQGGADVEVATLIDRARQAPVPLQVAPIWEHVVFSYLDRHHRKFRTVPGPTGVGEAALVMTGHPGGASDAAFVSAWPVVRDERTIHALAWFLPLGGVPTEEDLIRMVCPARTYVSTLRHDPDFLRMLTVEEGAPIASQIDEPHHDRLLFYDLPEAWHCDRYYGRRATDEEKLPYIQLARQTAVASPIVVSLDDVVVMRATEGGGKEPVSITRDFTIFDSGFEVYKPNERDPKDYGEPYYTDLERLKLAPGRGGVPAFLLLDPAPDMRALIHGDVFEVFDVRTTPEDGEVPVGARVAYSPFASGAPEDAEGWASKFCRVERKYRIPTPATRPEFIGQSQLGVCAAALFRCVGSSQTREHAQMLQYGFVAFDFSPSGPPPNRGKLIAPQPSDEKKKRLTAQALHLAHARWSGRPLLGRLALFEDNEGTNRTEAAGLPTPEPAFFISGEAPLRCGFAAIFFRVDRSDAAITFGVWSGDVRANAGIPEGVLDLTDLGAAESRSVVTHELGHVLGLPDEYVENLRNGSLGLPGFSSSVSTVPSSIYSMDVPAVDPNESVGPGVNRVDAAAIMKSNVEPRPRNFALLMTALLRRSGLGAAGAVWRRGERVFSSLPISHDLPGAVPDFFARREEPADLSLFYSGKRGCAAFMFQASPSPEAAVVMEFRVAVTFPASAGLAAQRVAMKGVAASVRRALADFSCFCHVRGRGHEFVCAAVVVPRFLCTTLPAVHSEQDRDDVNAYIRDLSPSVPDVLGPDEARELEDALPVEVDALAEKVDRLAEELATLKGAKDPSPVDLIVKQDALDRAKAALAEKQLDLLDPARAAARRAYSDLVRGVALIDPPHVELLINAALPCPVLGLKADDVARVIVEPDEEHLVELRRVVRKLFGVEKGQVDVLDTVALLNRFLDNSDFEILGGFR